MSSIPNKPKDAQSRRYERSTSVVFLKTNGEFGGLSNMAGGFPLKVNGLRIFTLEALYQACRFPHRPEVQRLIIGQTSPMTAKMKSKPYRHDTRPDWDRVRVKIMRWCLHVKLAQNCDAFSELLLKTGDRPIVEQSRKDAFWGAKETEDGTLVGRNVLGRLLMELREAVKTAGKDTLLRVEPLQIPDFLLDGRLIGVVQPVGAEKRELSPRLTGDGAPGTAISVGMRQTSLFDPLAVKETSSPEYASENPKSPGIAALKPYPEYKDSNLPWLGRIPKRWEMRRFKYLLREVNSRSSDGQDQLLSVSQYTGVTPRRTRDGGDEPDTRAASLVGYKRVAQDDLVVNIMLAWNGSLGVARSAGIVSPAYCVYRFNDNAEAWYYHNLLRLPLYKGRIKVESTGVVESRLRLYSDDLFRIEALVPPKKEQAAIARFASATGRQVDRLIRAKRRLIDLLNEQKQAIIHRSVTHGLDPNVRLKPSGVKWLGDVPEHWEVRRLRNFVKLIVSNVDKHTIEGEVSIRLCNYVDVYKNDTITEQIPFMQATATEDEVNRFRLRVGDVVITKDSEMWNDIGVPILVAYEAPDLVCGYHLAILRPDPQQMYNEFLLRCFQDPLLVTQLHIRANGITRYGLSQNAIKDCLVPVPPVKDQIYICAILQRDLAGINAAEVKARREIDLLREYRTRLITDVVTGKLDVRGVELPAMAEAEAEALEDLDTSEDTEGKEVNDTDEITNGDGE
jgi:type I restriction enzyme S subunit